jgi:glycosyltransferase involved in cell wall biosynthesis
MIFLIMPCNYATGWGICGTNLARELSFKNKIKYVSTEIYDENVLQNPIENAFFKQLHFDNLEYLKKQKKYPIIQALQHDLTEYMGDFNGSFKIGLTFSDRKIPNINCINACKKWDLIISGSTWSKNLLQDHGVESEVIFQGIDPLLYNSKRSKKQMFEDDFVVFSGGKFETRKGQDLTIKAFKVLQDKYPDVKLVCAWYNSYTNDSGIKELNDSGIDMNKVVLLPTMPNSCFPQIYQNTDIGIFPSRCEAGTNLVLMEYMACQKPVIASIGTGQGDIVNSKNGLVVENSGVCHLYENGINIGLWEEPNVDSLISNLEWAYNNRNKLNKLAKEANRSISKYTWKYMSERISSYL